VGEELRSDFHDQLADVHRRVEAMGADVVGMVRSAVDALLEGDDDRVGEVEATDAAVDAAYARVERDVYTIVLRQAPVARDLRLVVASLRVAQELERCGDLSRSIARRSTRLDETVLTPRVRLLIHELGAEAVSMLAGAVRAYGVLDGEAAAAVVAADEALDGLYAQLLRELFSLRQAANEPLVEAGLVARFLERLGDHAAVISERVHFINGGAFEPNDSDSG
jgi:phosphate transport system protein